MSAISALKQSLILWSRLVGFYLDTHQIVPWFQIRKAIRLHVGNDMIVKLSASSDWEGAESSWNTYELICTISRSMGRVQHLDVSGGIGPHRLTKVMLDDVVNLLNTINCLYNVWLLKMFLRLTTNDISLHDPPSFFWHWSWSSWPFSGSWLCHRAFHLEAVMLMLLIRLKNK